MCKRALYRGNRQEGLTVLSFCWKLYLLNISLRNLAKQRVN